MNPKPANLAEAWQQMTEWFTIFAGKYPIILVLALNAAVYLFITHKSLRERILIPLVVLVPVVINPILYWKVYYDLRYWRFLWLLPQVFLIAFAFAHLVQRTQKQWIKCLSLVMAAGSLALVGSNIFLLDSFTPANLPFKISRSLQQICETILADNPRPKCIFDAAFCIHTRSYSADITQAWGRDATGFIMPMDPAAKEAYTRLNGEDRDWAYYFQYAEENGYTHVTCTPNKKDNMEEVFALAEEHGYTMMEKINTHLIFKKGSDWFGGDDGQDEDSGFDWDWDDEEEDDETGADEETAEDPEERPEEEPAEEGALEQESEEEDSGAEDENIDGEESLQEDEDSGDDGFDWD